MKKKNVLILIIVALIISNLYTYNRVREQSQREHVSTYRGEIMIDQAIQEIAQLEYNWDALAAYEKIELLNKADNFLAISSELLNSSGKYFSPLKSHYRNEIQKMKATLKGYNDDFDVNEQIHYLNDEFQDLWNFLIENSIDELSQEEILKNWQNQ